MNDNIDIISSISNPKQKRLSQILLKKYADRSYQDIHQLSLAFKKKIIQSNANKQHNFPSQCVNFLDITTGQDLNIEQIIWIYVMRGKFYFHGMIYQQTEYLVIGTNQFGSIQFQKDSIYVILKKDGLIRAKNENDLKIINQQKKKTKKYIFKDVKIREKDFNILWDQMIILKMTKHQYLPLKNYGDIVFIIIEGRITIQYNWKRLIKIRDIGPGAIFSSYLGRFIYKSNINKSNQIIPNYPFKYFVNQSSLIMGFNPNIFYEQQRLYELRSALNGCWESYVERVNELKRIIQKVGALKPEKKEVVKSIKQKLQQEELRLRAVSVPIAIQKRKFKKIIFNFFDQKSNRRRLPNMATQSARNISNYQTISENSQQQPKFQIKYKLDTNRKKRTKTLSILEDLQKKDKIQAAAHQNKSTSLLFKYNTIAETALQEPSKISTQSFFKPQQFLSRKLRLEYQFICKKAQKLRLPVGKTEHEDQKKNFKTQKQYFQHYVNERRIIKLGPKKRLLYKQRKGF